MKQSWNIKLICSAFFTALGSVYFRFGLVDGPGARFRGLGRETADIWILHWNLHPHCCCNHHHNRILRRLRQCIHGKQNDAPHSKRLCSHTLHWCLDPLDFLWDFLRPKMKHGSAITLFCSSKPFWITYLNDKRSKQAMQGHMHGGLPVILRKT